MYFKLKEIFVGTFVAYRKSDKVYLQGSGEGEYPKAYREEYNRKH